MDRETKKEREYICENLVFDPHGSHELESTSSVGLKDKYHIRPKGQPVGFTISMPYMTWCDVRLTNRGGIILNPGGTFGSKIGNVVREQTPDGDIFWRREKGEFKSDIRLLEADGSRYDLHSCEYILWLQVKKEGLVSLRNLRTPNYSGHLSS